ncbi:MAG: NFACT family protein [Fervidobacterium sp.]
MPFDGFVMKQVVDEISKKIVGLNIRNVYLTKNTLYFSFDVGDLKVSLHPNYSHISLVEHSFDEFEKNNFLEFLRSRIRGAKVLSFSSIGYERTALLNLRKVDEVGISHLYSIYFDIMGKHSNAIIVENNIILDAFKRIETRIRKIMPQEKFIMYHSNKATIESIDSVDKLKIILQSPQLSKEKRNESTKITEAIYRNIQGFSKITAQELIYRAGLDDVLVSEFRDADFEKLFSATLSVLKEINSDSFWLFFNGEQPIDLSSIELHIYKDKKNCTSTIECVNEYFHFVENKDRIQQKKNQLIGTIKSKIEQYTSILENIERELSDCEEAEKFKKYGELLKAYFYQIEHGAEKVELFDWEDGVNVSIPLEKNLTPIENSQRFFNLYSKLKRKLVGLNERKEILEKDLSYLQQLQLTIESADSLEDLSEIEEEMVENNLIKKHKSGSKKEINQLSQPRKYIYNGFVIYVGKNNRQNDELVRSSNDKDLWLHAQGMPGAHVIIKTNGKDVDNETLMYAARLAATYSKGRYSAEVPVDYTLVKYVKKPKGLKPGLVLYSNFKTIFASHFQEKFF